MSSQTAPNHEIRIVRPAYDQQTFDDIYGAKTRTGDVTDKRSVLKRVSHKFKNCSPRRAARSCLRFLPVVKHLKEYHWKEWLLNDIISGLSGGVVHLPQGLGFAVLAGLPPVYGLYSSIFPGWLYYVFGTSRHLSVGTMAILSLMVGGVVNRKFFDSPTDLYNNHSMLPPPSTSQPENVYFDNDTMTSWENSTTSGNGSSFMDSQEAELVANKVGVAVAVTLLAGLFQLLMTVCRLSVIATYMSSSFISGFMTASAVQIIVSQIPYKLGLTIRRPYGAFELPLTIYQIFLHYTETNLSALLSSVISIFFLIAVKEGINERFKHRMRVPVPAELILVVLATIIAHFNHLNSRFGLAVIGHIPIGLPWPRPPVLASARDFIIDGVLIGLVGFSVAISMAKLMADRHRYEIDADQELLACGIYNTVSSFFGCFAATQAPPRTMVHESTGCKTQLTGFISTFVPLLVILCVGPLFYSLPLSVLGCIISCALLPLIKQFQQLRSLWVINRYDFAVWIVTFASSTIISITAGLIVGIAFNVLLTMIQVQRLKGYTLARAGDTEIYQHVDRSFVNSRAPVVFRFDGCIIFVNAENFVSELYKRTVNPSSLPLVSPTSPTTESANDDVKLFGDGRTGSVDDQTFPRASRQDEISSDNKLNIECDNEKRKCIDNTNKNTKCMGFDNEFFDSVNEKLERTECDNANKKLDSVELDSTHDKMECIDCDNVNKTIECDKFDNVNERNVESIECGDSKQEIEHIKCNTISLDVNNTQVNCSPEKIRTIVIDCTKIHMVDSMGVNALKRAWNAYKLVGIDLVLAGCSQQLSRQLMVVLVNAKGKQDENKKAEIMKIYPTVHDAVIAN